MVTYLKKAIELVERQIEFTEKHIFEAQKVYHCPFYSEVEKQKTLQWTGEPIELVELLYALHETGCLGKTFLKNLFSVASELFDCDVKNHYNLFSTIKMRVKGDRTLFLNKLKRGLTGKMEKMDERAPRR